MTQIPIALSTNIADSEIKVKSWSAESCELVLYITKDMGPECGDIQLAGVSLVSLPPRFSVADITVTTTDKSNIASVREIEGEFVFIFSESWGNNYYVVAESLSYVIPV